MSAGEPGGGGGGGGAVVADMEAVVVATGLMPAVDTSLRLECLVGSKTAARKRRRSVLSPFFDFATALGRR